MPLPRLRPPPRPCSSTAAMSIAGRLLSQPARVTSPSNRSACTMHSTESAMRSLLGNDARIPEWPIAMPSDTAIVEKPSPIAPRSRIPRRTSSARRPSPMLHGVTSLAAAATPTCAFSKSSSPSPTARSMARAGARSTPSVTSRLRQLGESDGIEEILRWPVRES